MARTIIVDITPDGEIIVDVDGVQGKGCDALTDAFVNAGDVSLQTKKPEYQTKTLNLNTVAQ